MLLMQQGISPASLNPDTVISTCQFLGKQFGGLSIASSDLTQLTLGLGATRAS